jgi:ribonuclease HI
VSLLHQFYRVRHCTTGCDASREVNRIGITGTEGNRMLLSIDRVLQLLAEGKSVERIAELSQLRIEDVRSIIENARKLLLEYNKAQAKKKIIIKKVDEFPGEYPPSPESDLEMAEIFAGAELTAVPLASSLTMYVDGASRGNPGPAGIGIVINDRDGRQVGKVSDYIGRRTNNFAEYTALIRALQIAIYFKTKELKIRTDSELAVKQIRGEYKVSNENIKPLYAEVIRLKKMINSCRIEHVTRNLNEKADYLAGRATTSYKKKM